MNRRTMLIGSGVVGCGIAGAVIGQSTHPGRAMLHKMGLVNSPDASFPASEAAVTEHQLKSPSLVDPLTYAVAATGSSPSAIVVCLHGASTTYRFPFDSLHLHDAVSERRHAWVLAAPDGKPASSWRGGSRGDLPAAIVDDLIPALRSKHGDLPVVIWGWSMGGFGALMLAAEHPSLFAMVVASSPALVERYSGQAGFADAASFDAVNPLNRVADLKAVPVRLDCGSDDNYSSLTQRLLDELGDGATGEISPGFHDDPYWRSRLPAQIDAVAAVLGP